MGRIDVNKTDPSRPVGAKLRADALINRGPFTPDELVEIARTEHPAVLASAWVALFIDSMSETSPIGPRASALTLAAAKLGHRRGNRTRLKGEIYDDLRHALEEGERLDQDASLAEPGAGPRDEQDAATSEPNAKAGRLVA